MKIYFFSPLIMNKKMYWSQARALAETILSAYLWQRNVEEPVFIYTQDSIFYYGKG